MLAELSQGFRGRYLDYAELTSQVQAWARAFPQFVRVESIGRSAEGRDLWLLTIGTDPDRVRPAVWVDGNMHASELCGSSVALAIAENAIRAHLEPAQPLHGLPRHVGETVRATLKPRIQVKELAKDYAGLTISRLRDQLAEDGIVPAHDGGAT